MESNQFCYPITDIIWRRLLNRIRDIITCWSYLKYRYKLNAHLISEHKIHVLSHFYAYKHNLLHQNATSDYKHNNNKKVVRRSIGENTHSICRYKPITAHLLATFMLSTFDTCLPLLHIHVAHSCPYALLERRGVYATIIRNACLALSLS